MATAVATPSTGFAGFSRAFVAVAADLVGTVERAVVGEQKIRTARGNAWDALCADRARAQARDELDALVRAMLADGRRSSAPAPGDTPVPPARPRAGTRRKTLATASR